MDAPAGTLHSVFGHRAFRPLQREIVDAVLAGRDAFVLMPTGGGKSLCYQLPALLSEGLTVVVSPLIALMKDQVDRLQALGVPATFVNSSLEAAEIGRRQGAVARGDVKLLYLAPERLGTSGFLNLLRSVPVARFAIDEAHCISEWGHDFRPDYRQLGQLRKLFPGVPVAAFTATATRRVQLDIIGQLGLKDAASFRGSFNRPNLYYQVRPKARAYEQLVRYLRSRPKASGIIYCLSRSGTENLAARLHEDGFSAVAYHAGLEGEERRTRQEAFARDDVRIVVATIAFGMGIDKPDVRFVVHYDVPRNLESYYQESGRAGRDGDPADCILFYSYADAAKQQRFIEEKPAAAERDVARDQLERMVDWAETTGCRRRELLAYFDETLEGGGGPLPPAGGELEGGGPCCDNCREPAPQQDYTTAAQKLLSAAKRTGERYGPSYLIGVLTGAADERILRAGHDRLPTYGVGKELAQKEWRHVLNGLVRAGWATITSDKFRTVQVTSRGEDVLFRGERVSMPGFRGAGAQPALPQDTPNSALFQELRELRKRIADQQGLPPYVVFHDSVLRQMATQLPANLRQLRTIAGIGERKLAEYGETFLQAIGAYVRRWGARPSPRNGAQPPPAVPAQARAPRQGLLPSVGPSVHATIELFRAGASIEEIGERRNMARSTIEGHLAEALEAGERLDLGRLVPPEKQQAIEAAIAAAGPGPLASLKERLGDGYSYGEIRFVRAALIR